jgi:hypothetical protein
MWCAQASCPSNTEAGKREDWRGHERRSATKECPSAAEADSLSERSQGVSFCGGSGLFRSGVCRGETPRTPPAAGEVALVPARFMWRAPQSSAHVARPPELGSCGAPPRARLMWRAPQSSVGVGGRS